MNSDELKYWFTNARDNEYLIAFLRRLGQIYIDCSSIINLKLNEELMLPLLSFIINRNYFPQLECLRFILCKNISSSWCNIDKWIDFIFTHINQHQIQCFRFNFIEKEHEITSMQTDDILITRTEPPHIIHVHRFVSETQISFWIERK
jgi:hypothetical protein